MDINDLFDEAVKETDSFNNHPACALPLDQKILYLKGLSLVMYVDKNAAAAETEYLRILLKSCKIDEALLQDLADFGAAPDKDTIQEFIRTFRRRPIAQVFLFDALMMSRRDGKVEAPERALTKRFADHLEILRGTQQDIQDLFCHILNKDWTESAPYFTARLLDPSLFKHLLDYHEVDLDELIVRTDALRQRRTRELLRNKLDFPRYTWGRLTYSHPDIKHPAGVVSKEAVSLKFPHDIMLPLLQAALDRREIRVFHGDLIIEAEGYRTNPVDAIKLTELGMVCDDETQTLGLADGADFGNPPGCPESLVRYLFEIEPGADTTSAITSLCRAFGAMPVFAQILKSDQKLRLPKADGQPVAFIPFRFLEEAGASACGIYTLDFDCGLSWVLGDKVIYSGSTKNWYELKAGTPKDELYADSSSPWHYDGAFVSVCRESLWKAEEVKPTAKCHQLASISFSLILNRGIHMCLPDDEAALSVGYATVMANASVSAAKGRSTGFFAGLAFDPNRDA